MTSAGTTNGALSGLKVLECSLWQQGPFAGSILADLGADVIKVESPDAPDPGRYLATPGSPEHGLSAYFESQNRNKRGVTIDLKHPEGRELLLRLARDTDIFLQNLRGGVMRRLRLTYEDVRTVNPRIVYASATGYGSEGPDADMPSMDIMAQARGGFISVNGGPEQPSAAFGGMADQVGAMMLVNGILAALLERERSGEGQHVEMSLLGAMMAFQNFHITGYLWAGKVPKRRGREGASPLWNLYAGSDGRWFVIGLPQGDRWWQTLCGVLDRDDLRNDPRFSEYRSRIHNSTTLVAELDTIFATDTTESWLQRLGDAGLMCSLVQDYADLAADPQVAANDYILNFDHPAAGSIPVINQPLRLSRTPASLTRPAPEYGQHTEEVLLEAGLTWDELNSLREAGVIGVRTVDRPASSSTSGTPP